MIRRKKLLKIRYFVLGGIFLLAIALFVIRLAYLQFNFKNTSKLRAESGLNYEYKTIQALRGSICDRNGKEIVVSGYSYDVVIDYDTSPNNKKDFNKVILDTVDAMVKTNNQDKLDFSYFPFEGAYPYTDFTSEAKDKTTSIGKALSKIMTRLNLEYGTTTKDEFLAVLEKRNAMNSKDDNGNPLYTSENKDNLLKVIYDMMRIQFSSIQPYTIFENADIDFVTYIKELSLEGVIVNQSTTRTYLYPGIASHILGRVGSISADDWEYYSERGYSMGDMVGISGCEKLFEEYLHAEDGVLTIERDKEGNIIREYVSKEPINGKDVWLTIDIDTQIAAEETLASYMKEKSTEKGATVAIDPQNGEILAIASYPTYDLTTFSEDYSALLQDKNSPLLNRAVSAYTPGSTFKIAVALMGLQSGAITKNTYFNCYGGYTLHGFNIACNNHTGVDCLNIIDAIRYSCNTYFIHLGYDYLSNDMLVEYCEKLGLGESTGIEISESIGQVACPDNVLNFDKYEEASSYIGQSVHQYTPIQIANYIATVSNGGTRYSAHLLKTVKTYSGETVYEKQAEVADTVEISEYTLSTIKEGMRQMVNGSGSATYYFYDIYKINSTVCGKSGTAQTGTTTQNCWFTAFAPKDNPQIVVASVIENGPSGASVSEIDAAVMAAYLNK